MRFTSRVPVVLMGTLTLACAPREGTPRADSPAAATSSMAMDPAVVRQSIEAANGKAMDAFKAGDAVGMAANYADDALVMMPNAPAWKGRAAVEKEMGGMIAGMDFKDPTFTTLDVSVAGDLAIETGTYKWMMGPKGGKLVADSGKYLTVWKKQADGSWKITRDINNSDVPVAAPVKK